MLRSIIRKLCLLPLASVLAASAAGPMGRAELPIESGGAFSVPLVSMKEMRFRSTIHQRYDFSCGSAAVATLLTNHYGYPVTEQAVFREMFEHGDKAKIKKEGFSLLDMKNYLATHGFEADGYIASIDKLVVAHVPAIALINVHGYHHFVVVKGLRDGRVLVGDPSAGTRSIPEDKFNAAWVNHILFIIKNRHDTARFNLAADWEAAPRAPIGEGLYHGGAEIGLAKYGPADF